MNAPGRKSNKPALIIMARLPQPGRVKTRLAATLGDAFAAHFYRLCAEHIVQETILLGHEVNRFLFYDDIANEVAVRRWLGPRFQYRAQVGENLGQRLAHAFQAVFDGGAEQAIIIGTDIPDLSAGVIRQALVALETYDSVIGPAEDGGYYLLGMQKMNPALFKDIAWSTNQVMAQTRQRIEQLHLTVHLLPTLLDIDTEMDLRKWIAGGGADQPANKN